MKAFDATPPTWGFAASPLIEGRLVVVPTGGPNSRGLLAFDRTTGKLVWNAPVARATAYASAITATLGGVRQVVASPPIASTAWRRRTGECCGVRAAPAATIEVSNSAIVWPAIACC